MGKILFKFVRSVLPCVLLTLCIGWCYSFSLFVPHLASLMGCTSLQIGFTFCLNIFFLGMGAAMFGPMVERHIKWAALVSTILLITGLGLAGLACSLHSLPLLYIGAGVLCGISEGCGYVTPNKNMLLWFPTSRCKGLLTAISILTFGFGSAICAWLFGMLFPSFGIGGTFYALAIIYSIPMLISTICINKPKYALIKLEKQVKSTFSYIGALKDSYFRKCWLFMFLNISMGLILIGSCASILGALGFSTSVVVTLMMLCGVFNGVGRLVFPTIGDFIRNRSGVWVITMVFELALMLPVLWAYSCGSLVWIAAIAIVLIHAGYGSAFACLPSILSSHFGKETLSQLHGFCLTSWGMASLMAFLCSTFILSVFNGFLPLMTIVFVGYLVNLVVARSISQM